ncbi:ACP phosphodiesterase [Marinicella rhabdoformis]|uniref:acyl carrier protein phosphodiesterase n=1 Tax=Marinicella rhabdoformis TaxID=2580566 RepID=UPI0012AEDF92|nr:ACP phosphodiesterase [Marinicella rhabdoformis]
MNWLAHVLLSKRDVEYQLGNLLADPMKGRVWDGAPQSIEQGMLMHKAIDAFTDSHAVVAKSKSRFEFKGYLKGVVVDLLYDHFLAVHWQSFSETPLDNMLAIFHQESDLLIADFPPKAHRVISRVIETNMLGSYAEFSGFVAALLRVELRLSDRIKAKDSMNHYVPTIESTYEQFESDFLQFFPQLIEHFKNHPLGSQSNNYLI